VFWPPSDMDSFRSRNEQLARVAAFMRDQPNPRILVGDLNTTMWSSSYAEFASVSKLGNCRRGFGVLPTFPMDQLPLLRVPLDHCLVSPDLAVLDCRLGNPAGSDHAPLIVELAPSARP
jgi:endonuclease/exonuclease/phosphatase (EEP) superfamily protein YafD